MENIKNYKFSVKKRVSLLERLPDYRNILFTKIMIKKEENKNLTCKICGSSVITAANKLSTSILYK